MQSIPITPRVVMLGAAQRLRARGWCQFRLAQPTGETCMLGALAFYINENVADERQRAELTAITSAQLLHFVERETGHTSPMYYNDAWGRTREQVIGMLERAALAA